MSDEMNPTMGEETPEEGTTPELDAEGNPIAKPEEGEEEEGGEKPADEAPVM